MDIWYRSVEAVLRMYRILFIRRVYVSGNVPIAAGPKIIAANHPNATDVFTLPYIFRERLSVLTQASLFRMPFVGWMLEKSEQIPVTSGNWREIFTTACRMLEQGRSIVVFPEGRLNPENQTVRCGTGAVRIAIESGAPILPVGFFVPEAATRLLKSVNDGITMAGRWQVRGHCYVRIGEFWHPGKPSDRRNLPDFTKTATEQLMTMIRRLTDLARLETEDANRAG